MTDEDGLRLEAAEQYGFEEIDGQPGYFCKAAELIAFAKACERAGMVKAQAIANIVSMRATLGRMSQGYRLGWSAGGCAVETALKAKIAELDAELKPLLERTRA